MYVYILRIMTTAPMSANLERTLAPVQNTTNQLNQPTAPTTKKRIHLEGKISRILTRAGAMGRKKEKRQQYDNDLRQLI